MNLRPAWAKANLCLKIQTYTYASIHVSTKRRFRGYCTTDDWSDWHWERARQNRLSLHAPKILTQPHTCPAFLCRGGRKGLLVTKWQNKLSARPFPWIHSSLSVKWFHHQVLAAPREEGRTRLQVPHRVTVYSNTDVIFTAHRYPTFRLNCSFFQKTFTELHLQYTSVSHVPSARKVMKARLNPKAHSFLSLQFPHPRAWQAWP